MSFKKLVFPFLLFIFLLPITASTLFSTNISGMATGPGRIGDGKLPLSFSLNRTGRLKIFETLPDKATISVSSGFSLSDTSLTFYFDKETGTPTQSWIGENGSDASGSIEYYNPAATLSLSLSQKVDDWTYSISLGSRYSFPGEALSYSSSEETDLTFSEYKDGKWVKKYNKKDEVYAYPYLYGERTNLSNNFSLSASRSIYTFKNLSSFNINLSFTAGPEWMLNSILNDITLSDYYTFYGSISQSMLIKDETQSISLRWLRISLSHSNSLSYTLGKIVPENRLNSFRLRGYLSDSLSIYFSGPQILDSGTSISYTFSYNNTLYFGGFENEKSGKSRGMAYSSSFSSAFNLSLFGFLSFGYSLTYYIANGYYSSYGLSGSGEVSMSFTF